MRMLKKDWYIIIFIFLLGILIGIIFGYYITPFGVFECFKKLGYQNITCFHEGKNYHCLRQDGIGYILENAVRQ